MALVDEDARDGGRRTVERVCTEEVEKEKSRSTSRKGIPAA